MGSASSSAPSVLLHLRHRCCCSCWSEWCAGLCTDRRVLCRTRLGDCDRHESCASIDHYIQLTARPPVSKALLLLLFVLNRPPTREVSGRFTLGAGRVRWASHGS